eukprot:5859547-Pleurochrysis_carterae.AAC.1
MSFSDDMKAYHLGADALLQSVEVREAAANHYIQSQAAVDRAVATRNQVDVVEAPAVAPAVASAAAPSSSTAASTATSNEARERAALLARQATSGAVQPTGNAPSSTVDSSAA